MFFCRDFLARWEVKRDEWLARDHLATPKTKTLVKELLPIKGKGLFQLKAAYNAVCDERGERPDEVNADDDIARRRSFDRNHFLLFLCNTLLALLTCVFAVPKSST